MVYSRSFVLIILFFYGGFGFSFLNTAWPADWVKTFGTTHDDFGKSLAVDADGNTFIAGYSENSAIESKGPASINIFVTKYDPSGAKVWQKNMGTDGDDYALGISLDKAGNIYVTGYTFGGFQGGNKGNGDAFVVKLDGSGNEKWIRQFGTSAGDAGMAVAVDAQGAVYVTGYTAGNLGKNISYKTQYDWDAFLVKFSAQGMWEWTKILGVPGAYDYSYGVTTDSDGNIIITGKTAGDLGGEKNKGKSDIFAAKFDSNGNERWVKVFGTKGEDIGYGIDADGQGNIYVVGTVSGSLKGNISAGSSDIFLAKISPGGDSLWFRQIGSKGADNGWGVTADSNGNAFVTGISKGDIDGYANKALSDAYIAKYNPDGIRLWSELLGMPPSNNINGIGVDAKGKAYVSGYVKGNVGGGEGTAGYDVAVIKVEGDRTSPLTSASPGGGLYNEILDIKLECNDATGTGCARIYYTTDGTEPGESSSVYGAEITFPASGTVKYFSVDNSGNAGEIMTDKYTIDLLSPRKTSIVIDGDVEQTISRDVNVAISAKDNRGVVGYYLSETVERPSRQEFLSVKSVESFSVKVSFTLSEEYGEKKIYAWYLDKAGNISMAVQDSIDFIPDKWVRLLSGKRGEAGKGIAVDSEGNAYITGATSSNLSGSVNNGSSDAFIAKYDKYGRKKWVEMIGTESYDLGIDIAVDSGGAVYAVGSTGGGLEGRTNFGYLDAFIVKYDADGSRRWVRTLGASGNEWCRGVAVDNQGYIYVVGDTEGSMEGQKNLGSSDVFVAKYDSDGNRLWIRLFGTHASDIGNGVAVDASGGVYVVASTNGKTKSGARTHVLVAKFDGDGTLIWEKAFGTRGDNYGMGIAADVSGSVYVVGSTMGSMGKNKNAGEMDAFLVKFDANGKRLWTRLLGTKRNDYGLGAAVDNSGDIYVTGGTEGKMGDYEGTGSLDVFTAKYDANGNRIWVKQTGSDKYDFGYAIDVNKAGTAYVTGYSKGDMEENKNSGGSDVLIWKM